MDALRPAVHDRLRVRKPPPSVSVSTSTVVVVVAVAVSWLPILRMSVLGSLQVVIPSAQRLHEFFLSKTSLSSSIQSSIS